MKSVKRLGKDLVEIKTNLITNIELLKTIEDNNNNKIVITQVLLAIEDVKNNLNEACIHLSNLIDLDIIFNKNDDVFYIDVESNEAVNALFESYSDDYAYCIIKVDKKQVCVKATRLLTREL